MLFSMATQSLLGMVLWLNQRWNTGKIAHSFAQKKHLHLHLHVCQKKMIAREEMTWNEC